MDPRPTSRPRARLAPRPRPHPHRRLPCAPHLARPIAAIAALAAIFALSSPQPTAAQEQTGRLTPELYFEWEEVRPFLLAGGMGPQISPDGSQVLYERRHIDRMKDRWVSELHIVGADGARARQLTDGGGAVWAPDGERIAFVRADDAGAAQIFVRWMDAEGAETQVSHLTRGPGGLTWSPDGETLAFSMMVPSEPEWTVTIPGRPEGAEWTVEPKVVTRPNYRRDYVGYTDDGYRHIFVLPATGGTPRQLTDGDWNHGAPVWSADGSEILFSALREPDSDYRFRESEIYAVSVASGAIRQLTTRAGSDHSPVPSPDGRMACGLNRGRKSSNCIQDCTICASCRWTGSRWTAPRKRKNGFEWRESQTSVASRLCRLAPEGHPRCSSPDGRPAAPRRNAIQNARGYGDTRLPSGISRPIPNKRWPGKVTPPVRQWQSGTRPYTTPSIAFSEGRGGVARGLCGKRMPPSSPRVRVVAFRLAGVFFEPDDQ